MLALVLTNCESMDEKTRSEVVNEFRSNPLTKATAELMKAGIHTVGFPHKYDYSGLPPPVKTYYEESIAKNREILWELVKRSSNIRHSKKNCLFGVRFMVYYFEA